MYKAVPPMTELFNMAGLELPSYLDEKSKPMEKNQDITNDKREDKTK